MNRLDTIKTFIHDNTYHNIESGHHIAYKYIVNKDSDTPTRIIWFWSSLTPAIILSFGPVTLSAGMLTSLSVSLPDSTVDRLEDFVYICADKTLVYEEIGHHNCRNACKSSRRECSELRTCRGIVWSDGIDIRSGENKYGELLFYRDGSRIRTEGKHGKVVFTVQGSIPLPILIWISVLDWRYPYIQ